MPLFIVTLHRIVSSGVARSFYDVSLAALEAHLDALHTRGIAALDPNVVPDGSGSGYLLTFDDGTRDHFEQVLPFLQERGERGIFFVPTAKIAAADRISADQIRALADAGHVIGCHSHDHVRLDTLSAEAVRGQLSSALSRLREITGRETFWFAPPGGYSSALVRRVAAEVGLKALRTMCWGRNETLRLDRLECLPLNRSISPERFGKILDGRGLAWLKALYLGKQALKALLPLRAYEQARDRY